MREAHLYAEVVELADTSRTHESSNEAEVESVKMSRHEEQGVDLGGWRNWQTRRPQEPLGQPMEVQILFRPFMITVGAGCREA